MLSFLLTLALNSASPVPATPVPLALPIVLLHAPAATLQVEVASTEAQRETGLMDRTTLPEHTGMVFVFDRDAAVEFWMKNTLVPLDMVFVSAKGVVRSVAANVPVVPLDTPDERIPRRDGVARYVIELPANEAAKDGLKRGAKISGLPRTSP